MFKKTIKYLKWAGIVLLVVLMVWSISIYCRRNALLKQTIEKQIGSHYSTMQIELGSARFSGWDGFNIKTVTVKDSSGLPVCELQEIDIDCPLSLLRLIRKDIKVNYITITGATIHLPTSAALNLFGSELEKKLTGKFPCPLELKPTELVCPFEHGRKKLEKKSPPFNITLFPPGTNGKIPLDANKWTVYCHCDDPKARPGTYSGGLTHNFDKWITGLL